MHSVRISHSRSSIYKFPLIQTEAEKEREINLIASKQVISAKQQSKVQQVTRDLVQWAEQLVSPHCVDVPVINVLILREEVRVVPILMSRPSRVCLAAIMRLKYVSS